jgi:hypothetical protein
MYSTTLRALPGFILWMIFVYSLNGQAAFWISGDYWYPYPSSGTPAFWVSGKFIYDNPPSGTPKYYMP